MEALLPDTHDRLTRTMFRTFGYWPSPSDDHIGEYLPYAAEFTGLCRTQIAVQKLAVEAAVSGDREKALQALLIDPVVGSYDAAVKTHNDLLNVHKSYHPNFFKEEMNDQVSSHLFKKV